MKIEAGAVLRLEQLLVFRTRYRTAANTLPIGWRVLTGVRCPAGKACGTRVGTVPIPATAARPPRSPPQADQVKILMAGQKEQM